MSSDVPADSMLASDVPKIVITQPSPQRPQDARVPGTPFSNPISVDPPVNSTVAESLEQSFSEEQSITILNPSITESEGFEPSVVRLKVDEDSTPTIAPVENVAQDDCVRRSFHDRLRCDGSCIRIWDICKNACLLPLLFSLAITAVFVGGFYMDQCSARPEVPVLMFMIGIAACMVLLSWLIMSTIGNENHPRIAILSTIIICGSSIILLLFCVEMVAYWTMSPSYQLGNWNYCAEVFYQISYYLNWFGLFFISLMGIIHVPKICRPDAS